MLCLTQLELISSGCTFLKTGGIYLRLQSLLPHNVAYQHHLNSFCFAVGTHLPSVPQGLHPRTVTIFTPNSTLIRYSILFQLLTVIWSDIYMTASFSYSCWPNSLYKDVCFLFFQPYFCWISFGMLCNQWPF